MIRAFSYQHIPANFDVCVGVGFGIFGTYLRRLVWDGSRALAANGRFAASIATPAMNGTFFEWRDPAGSAANKAGSFPANYPNTWLRLQRVSNTIHRLCRFTTGKRGRNLAATAFSMSTRWMWAFGSAAKQNGVTTAQFFDFLAE